MQVQIILLLLFDFYRFTVKLQISGPSMQLKKLIPVKSPTETIVMLNLLIISSVPIGRASYKSAKEECGRSF